MKGDGCEGGMELNVRRSGVMNLGTRMSWPDHLEGVGDSPVKPVAPCVVHHHAFSIIGIDDLRATIS